MNKEEPIMEQGKYEQRERLIREYFRCWLENRPEKLGDIFEIGRAHV